MSSLAAPPNVPVWVDYNRCKGCDICVALCPSGTLAMKSDKSYVSGKIIEIINPNNCIGCNNCEYLVQILQSTWQARVSLNSPS